MTHPPGNMQRQTAQILGIAASLILLFSAMILAYASYLPLRELQQDSEQARGEILAQTLSTRIAHALSIGIPLDSLVGVGALFDQQLSTHAYIESIELLDTDGRVRWATRRTGEAQEVGSHVTRAGVQVMGRQEAVVQLTLRPARADSYVRSVLTLLFPAILLLGSFAFLAVRFCQYQGPLLRNFVVRLTTADIVRRRFDRVFVLPDRCDFDLRALQLNRGIRTIHETIVRVRRLIVSLRQTEPERLRRDRLDHFLALAESQDQFSKDRLHRIHVVAAQAQAFWIAMLTSLGAGMLINLAWSRFLAQGPATPAPEALPVVLFVAFAAGGWYLARLSRCSAFTVQLTACLVLCAIVLLAATGLPGGSSLITYVSIILCASAAGAGLAACDAVEHTPKRGNGVIQAYPHWPSATAGAWVLGLVWLVPALSLVSYAAFGFTIGNLMSLLPVVGASTFLLKWNSPRSAWRVAIQPQKPPQAVTPGSSLLAALPLIAGTMLAVEIASMASGSVLVPPNTSMVCALGLGITLGFLAHGPKTWRGQCTLSMIAVGAGLLAASGSSLVAWETDLIRVTLVPFAQFAAVALTAFALGRAFALQGSINCSGRSLAVSALAALTLELGAAAGLPIVSSGAIAALLLAWHGYHHLRTMPRSGKSKGKNAT